MKRLLSLVMVLLLACGPARAEYWTDITHRPVVCCDDRLGCQVLQTVMMGSFARFDPGDSLNARVFSAALPRLLSVTEDDFIHFSQQFSIDAQSLRRLYFVALGNCLWADIIVSPQAEDPGEQNARTVLYLFLSNSGGADAALQREAIRSAASVHALAAISENAGVPVPFVTYIILGKLVE